MDKRASANSVGATNIFSQEAEGGDSKPNPSDQDQKDCGFCSINCIFTYGFALVKITICWDQLQHCRIACAHPVYTQELECKLKEDLQRPDACIPDSLVSPEVQCPQKPRGRKKEESKANSSKDAVETHNSKRPSAAACGFDTTGMSLKDIMKELEKRKNGDESKKPMPEPEKKTRKAKRTSHLTTTAMPEDDVCNEKDSLDNAKKTKKRKGDTQAATKAPEPCKSVEAHQDQDCTQQDKPGSAEINAGNDKHDNLQSKEHGKGSKGRKNKSKDKEEGTTVPATQKRARKAAAVNSGEGNDKPMQATTATDAANKPMDDTKPSKRTRATKTKTAGAGGDEPSPDNGSMATADERKKRYSRKSAAYHRARKIAKQNGATDEEALAAAKQATWMFL